MRQTKLSQFRVPSQLRRCCGKWTWTGMLAGVVWLLGRVAVLYLHSAHHKVARFITKISEAIGRKQKLLEKCTQGKSVPFLRRGTASWPSAGARRNCLAGWRRRHSLVWHPEIYSQQELCDPPGFCQWESCVD